MSVKTETVECRNALEIINEWQKQSGLDNFQMAERLGISESL